tara:strand:+ start:4449 stop:5282 length:834 start_codon:yes stop_codon:yes gene_type:complete
MKNKLFTTGAVLATVLLSGCSDGLTPLQERCLEEHKGYADKWEICVTGDKIRSHERSMARIESDMYDGNGGYYQPQPLQQMPQQMPMYQDQGFDGMDMALAAVGGGLLTGYAMHKMQNGKYGFKDRKGNIISHSEYANRVRQSSNQKLKNNLAKSEKQRKLRVDENQKLREQIKAKNAEITAKNKALEKKNKQIKDSKKRLDNNSKKLQDSNNKLKQQKEKEKFKNNKDTLKSSLKKKQEKRKLNKTKTSGFKSSKMNTYKKPKKTSYKKSSSKRRK